MNTYFSGLCFPHPQKIRAVSFAAWLIAASPLVAGQPLKLTFLGPVETTAQHQETLTTFRLPIGPFQAGTMTTSLAEGALDQSAYRIDAPDVSTLQLLQPLRAQISQAGFTVIYECETEGCGGFDFRFGTAVLPEPDMHIDLGDFRYLAAQRDGVSGPEYISLLISKSRQNGFVQVTNIGAFGALPPSLTTSSTSALQTTGLPVPEKETTSTNSANPSLAELGKQLDLGQPQVLEDLVFNSGSASLAPGDYQSLNDLAEWLHANPRKTVTVVGHTDASGGLAGNIALSRKRAQSVRQYLLAELKILPDQIAADGVGYLAPRASNETDAGRQKNRRVEVMITSTQ